jgi:glycosyltransferase involved in cell wall biosynthesis
LKILFVSDFDLRGSGYQSITAALASELWGRGHEVVVIGFDYKGEEHHYPFAVVSTDEAVVGAQIAQTVRGFQPDAVALVSDLDHHEKFAKIAPGLGPLYVGVFAVEAPPIIRTSAWAQAIRTMDLAYSISSFGAEEGQKVGLDVRHLPVGVDRFWQPLPAEERKRLRASLGLEDRFVVLTVADNQERKNLPGAVEAIAHLRERVPEAFWALVTKKRAARICFDVWDLLVKHELPRHSFVYETDKETMPRERLRELYGIADAFLLSSKAEGLCLPVLEAMACGTPCVAPALCELPRMLEGRGLLAEVEYWYTDAFGNQRRGFVDPRHAAKQLERLASEPELRAELSAKSLEYTRALTWGAAADIFERDLHVVKEAKAGAQAPESTEPVAATG